MKKIFSLFAIFALGGIVLSSCDDDDSTNDVTVHGVNVISAETFYTAAGGTGVITVEGNVASAYSNASWISPSVNGSTVTLNVNRNDNKESRHTTVVVKSSEQDSAVVNIDQSGSLISSTMPLNIHASNDAQTLTYTYETDEAVALKVTNTSDWVKATAKDGKIVVNVDANTTGPRRDTLTISGDVSTYTTVITQYDFDKDIAGDYYLLDGDSLYNYGVMSGAKVQISSDGNNSIAMNFPDYGLSLPVTWNENAMSLTIHGGTFMGSIASQGETYYIFSDLLASNGYIYWNNSITYTAPFDYDADEDLLMAEFEDDGSISSSVYVNGISLDVFSKNTVSSSAYLEGLLQLSNPVLFKVPSGSEAKAKTFRGQSKMHSKLSGKLSCPRRLVPIKTRKLMR